MEFSLLLFLGFQRVELRIKKLEYNNPNLELLRTLHDFLIKSRDRRLPDTLFKNCSQTAVKKSI